MADGSVLDLIALDERLRMVPVDRSALTEAVDRLLSDADTACAGGDSPRELSALRPAGVGLIVLGRHDAARAALWRARELAAGLSRDHVLAATEVNLGDAHRYAGDHAAAEPHYRAAVALGRGPAPTALAFALHHLGKHLAERGETAEATACLTEALRLRLADGDPELIESTEAALRLATA